MTIDTERFQLSEHQWIAEPCPKDLIVLHFTAGFSTESAWRTWQTNPYRIATAFGVDRDGSIYRHFPSEHWAYHLGVKRTSRHDRRSIGIEIANVGPLKLDPTGRSLCYWPGNWTSKFCAVEETARFLYHPYRSIDYWAAMPDVQQVAVGELVRDLCQRHGIPLWFSSQVEGGEYCLGEMDGYTGIATHTNFRRDKWDVGPAFDWSHLGSQPIDGQAA